MLIEIPRVEENFIEATKTAVKKVSLFGSPLHFELPGNLEKQLKTCAVVKIQPQNERVAEGVEERKCGAVKFNKEPENGQSFFLLFFYFYSVSWQTETVSTVRWLKETIGIAKKKCQL